MHILKEIRENSKVFEKKINDRGVNFKMDKLLELDKKNRSLIQKKETLEQEKKSISKSKDSSLFEKSKTLSKEIEKITKEYLLISNDLEKIVSNLPNLALDDVPLGKDENSNKEISKFGKIKEFNFSPKSHYELGKNLKMLDFELATKTSGSRFVFLKNQLAQMERAISNFMLDMHTKKFGYSEISPPLIVTDKTMFGTGQLPKFEEDQFEIKLENERKFLNR